MAVRLLFVLLLTSSLAEEFSQEPELATQGLEADEVCDGREEDCAAAALSLRQLRSKQLTELQAAKGSHDASKDAGKDTAEDATHHAVQGSAEAVRADVNHTRDEPACARWTGGTCLLGKCDSSRGAACKNGICYCGEGMCAKEGKCEKSASGSGGSGFGNFMKCETKLEQHCIYGCNDDNAACSWGTCHCKEGYCNFGGHCMEDFMSKWMPSNKEAPVSSSSSGTESAGR